MIVRIAGMLLIVAALSGVSSVASASEGARLRGVVKDRQGAPVADADVSLASADRTTIVSGRTDREGRFTLDTQPGSYVLIVRAPLFTEARRTIVLAREAGPELEIVLEVAGLAEEVTVTASERPQDILAAAQAVSFVDRAEIEARVKTVTAQAIEGEAGVALQRTSPTMAGVFVRGLTGNKVNVFIDGVRYSNGAQRGGVNTFLDLIEAASLGGVEVLRGPSSAQYGSDALGGSVQFLTEPPSLFSGGARVNGTVGVSGGTAHRNGGVEGSFGYAGARVGLVATASGRQVGLIRTGGGIDSHSAVTRFLGIRSDRLIGERLPDTGFGQFGGSVRANWMLSADTRVVTSYFRSDQDRGRRYDQLLGGDGNLIAELNDLSLHLFYTRVERAGLGPFDTASVTYSVNSQREERVNQGGNGNPTATISHEPERATAHGIHGSAVRELSRRHSMSIGGDVYFERVRSESFNVNPVTFARSVRRPRIPDKATFVQGGVYAQSSFDAVPDRVRLVGSARVGGASYASRAANAPVVAGQPLWPDDSLTVGSVTFRAGAVVSPDAFWTLTGNISRGFRAPHMTDFGTLGLTGAGFEIAAPDVAKLDARVGSTADASAVSTGRPVEQLKPETSLSYEGSLRYRRRVFDASVTMFVNTVHDNIQKVALILPAGAVGQTLGGTPIVSQNANGAVFVAATNVPVLVRTNFDEARIWGLEQTARVRIGAQLSAQSAFTYLRARDLATGLPPNIEGGTPAPELWLSAQYTAKSGRYWVQPYAHIGWEQPHLSTLDLGDRRAGAARSRANIQAFFRNGATARGWVSPGADGVFGNADDILTVTGETLTQVQDRVLGPGVAAAPMFTAIPGYQTYGIRAGLRIARHDLLADVENLTDENYRGLSWGVDAPGRGVSVRFVARF
jgi:hemoglobin/transferrin/lactoferrin receptor protein